MLKNKKFVIVLVALFLASLVYLYFYTQQKPSQKTSIGNSPEIRTPHINTPTLIFKFPDGFALSIPTEVNIYNTGRSSLDVDQAQKIADGLGFNVSPQKINDPVYGPTYLWTKNGPALTIKFQSRIISYTASSFNENSGLGFNQGNEAVLQKTNEFLNKINQAFNLKLQASDINYLRIYSEESVQTASPLQSNLVKVKVESQIDEFPVIGSAALLTPSSEISLDNKLVIMSALITLPPLEIISPEKKATLSLNEIMKTISEAKLINLENSKEQDASVDPLLGEIIVEKAYLAYYQYSSQQTIQPVLVVEGSGKTKNGNIAQGIFVKTILK